jgi:S-adenosylmethionine-diacylglycerol 3-amino-3-carboxypropyl transferase
MSADRDTTSSISEAAAKADFESFIRYAQVWEDADVLLAGLDVQEGDTCLSIASAGDNAISLLTRRPAKVIAVDLNPAQLACVALRAAAYQVLEHAELLKLIGSLPAGPDERVELYHRCRLRLSEAERAFWDERHDLIRRGIGTVGRFERYFTIFRRFVLPLVHRRGKIDALLRPKSADERRRFFDTQRNTCAWRAMFAIFFSRFVMGRLGRDPAMFDYVEGSVADRIRARADHALRELDPSLNPYLQWILTGRHRTALPHALRKENFETIRNNIHRLQWRRASVEQYLAEAGERAIDRYNLSDIFEYMSDANVEALLRALVRSGRPGGRLVYWNMLAPRSRPESMADVLRPLDDLARQLHLQDKAFFYSRLVIEEIR